MFASLIASFFATAFGLRSLRGMKRYRNDEAISYVRTKYGIASVASLLRNDNNKLFRHALSPNYSELRLSCALASATDDLRLRLRQRQKLSLNLSLSLLFVDFTPIPKVLVKSTRHSGECVVHTPESCEFAFLCDMRQKLKKVGR